MIYNMDRLYAGLHYCGEIRGIFRLYNTFYLAKHLTGYPLVYEWIPSSRGASNGPSSYYLGNDIIFLIRRGFVSQDILSDRSVSFKAINNEYFKKSKDIEKETAYYKKFFKIISGMDWQVVALAAAYIAERNKPDNDLALVNSIVAERKRSIYTTERIVQAINFISEIETKSIYAKPEDK